MTGMPAPPENAPLLRQLLLVDYTAVHPLAWSLAFELRFYLAIAVVVAVGAAFRRNAFIAWAILQTAAVFAAQLGYLPGTNLYTSTLMLEFVMGVAVGALVVHRVDVAPAAILLAGVIGMGLAAAFAFTPENMMAQRFWYYGIPAALILYGAITLESRGQLKVPQVLFWIGEASYSLYMWHFPALRWTQQQTYWMWEPGWLSALGYMAVSIPVVAAVTAASYFVIERPMIVGARKLMALRPSFAARGAGIS